MNEWRWWERMFFLLAFATVTAVLVYMIGLIVKCANLLGGVW